MQESKGSKRSMRKGAAPQKGGESKRKSPAQEKTESKKKVKGAAH